MVLTSISSFIAFLWRAGGEVKEGGGGGGGGGGEGGVCSASGHTHLKFQCVCIKIACCNVLSAQPDMHLQLRVAVM